MFKYVRSNPSTHARYNGLLPLPTKIRDRVWKELKYLNPYETKDIVIPWSDFVFSNSEPWPKQFREGLEKFCEFYQNRPVIRPSEEKKYKFSPSLQASVLGDLIGDKNENVDLNEHSFTHLVTKKVRTLAQLMEHLPLLSEKDLLQKFQKKPNYWIGSYSENLWNENSEFCVWVVPEKRFGFLLDVPAISAQRKRIADCNGVHIRIIGFCDPDKKNSALRCVERPGIRGYIQWTNWGLLVTAEKNSESTLLHELMHLTQYAADELLFARTRPQHAFVDLRYAPKVYGFGKKQLRIYDKPSYLEKSIEFYPNAYSSGQRAVIDQQNADESIVYRISEGHIPHLLDIQNPKLTRKFLETAVRYAGQTLTPEDKEILEGIVSYDPRTWGELVHIAATDSINTTKAERTIDALAVMRIGVDLSFKLGIRDEQSLKNFFIAYMGDHLGENNLTLMERTVHRVALQYQVAQLILDEAQKREITEGALVVYSTNVLHDFDLWEVLALPYRWDQAPLMQRIVQKHFDDALGRPTNEARQMEWHAILAGIATPQFKENKQLKNAAIAFYRELLADSRIQALLAEEKEKPE